MPRETLNLQAEKLSQNCKALLTDSIESIYPIDVYATWNQYVVRRDVPATKRAQSLK